MTYTVHTAREFYSYEQDAQAILDLKAIGFHFEEWGEGFVAIYGTPNMYVFCLDQITDLAKRFGEITLTPNKITIQNWMKSEDLVPHDA
jgi:hypothetical protein